MASFGALMLIISIAIFFGDVDGQAPFTQYSTRYNNLNIDQILSNERLVTNYVECLLSRKPCTPEGKDLKRILPEALRTKCARCSSQQYEGGLRVITKLYYDYPVQYNRLKSKWDPTGEYHRRFEEYLRGLQFNVINSESTTTQSQTNNNAPVNQTIIASASSNSQSVIPTNLPSNTAQFNNTQRPARNPEIGQKDQGSNVRTPEISSVPTGVFNRFGADDEEDSAKQPKPMVSTSTTERISPTTATVPTQRATKRPSKRPNIVVNEAPATVRQQSKQKNVVGKKSQPTVEYTVYTFNTQPDVVYVTQQHPLIGLINSIGFKISNTADFFAGMLRGTIQVIEEHKRKHIQLLRKKVGRK